MLFAAVISVALFFVSASTEILAASRAPLALISAAAIAASALSFATVVVPSRLIVATEMVVIKPIMASNNSLAAVIASGVRSWTAVVPSRLALISQTTTSGCSASKAKTMSFSSCLRLTNSKIIHFSPYRYPSLLPASSSCRKHLSFSQQLVHKVLSFNPFIRIFCSYCKVSKRTRVYYRFLSNTKAETFTSAFVLSRSSLFRPPLLHCSFRFRNRYSSSSFFTFSGISRPTGQTAAWAIRRVNSAIKAMSFCSCSMLSTSGRS